MDEDRKIRFLIAPLLFFASLAWGVAWDPARKLSELFPGASLSLENWYQLIAFIAGGGIAVFTLGVVIGTATYAVLRVLFVIKSCIWGGTSCHEVSLPTETLKQMWAHILAQGDFDRREELYIGVTFDHDLLRSKHEGVHRWIVRRWNAFSVSVTSAIALLLSLWAGYLLNVTVTLRWWVPVVVVSVMFAISAIFAWRDTMGILRFQARRQLTDGKSDG